MFEQSKLDRSVIQTRGIFNKYIYDTADTIDDVQVAGYFSASRFKDIDDNSTNGQGWEGGIIECKCSDGLLIGEVGAGNTLTNVAGSPFNEMIIANTAEDLSGALDSTKLYFLDGIIDFTGTGINIEVPAGGLSFMGHSFNISGLICTDNNYTLFASPIGGSGDLLGADYLIDISGTGSKVYDLVSDTGVEAFEFQRINYNNCTSLGEINNYRQGLEIGTGRFGATPELTLSGVWLGGYRITTSIVRSIDNAMNAPLFKAGVGFVMNSRFLTDINADLGTTAELVDFATGNFANPSTLQIHGAIITRNGVADANDSTLIPNITAADLKSSWKNNQGLPNTFEGGKAVVTAEVATDLVSAGIGVFADLAGTWTVSELEHFDSPANGQLRHLGDNPREYRLVADLIIDGTANDVINIKIRKWDSSATSFVDVFTQTRQINSLVGARDVGFFNMNNNFILDKNDYIILQASNDTAGRNVTAELDGFFDVEAR